jgi:hypothetical protein
MSGQKPQSVYFEGDPLMVEVAGPPFDSHIYVDYFLQDGSVYHMMPSSTYRDNFVRAGQRSILGTPGSGVTWNVSPPFGTEMITIIAAPQRLLQSERPEIENSQAYLSALRSGLEAVYAQGEGNRVAADIYLLTTQARP